MTKKMIKRQKAAYKAEQQGTKEYKATRIINGKQYTLAGGPIPLHTANILANDSRLEHPERSVRLIRLKRGTLMYYRTKPRNEKRRRKKR